MKCKRCGKEFIILHIEELNHEKCSECLKKECLYEIDNLCNINAR